MADASNSNNGEECFSSSCSFDVLCDGLVANIFDRLTVKEKLSVIPRVCRRWHRLSQDALCWQCIDLNDWGDGWNLQGRRQLVERLIHVLVSRSGGCLREFTLTYIFFPIEGPLRLIAERGQSLQRLWIVGAKITDECAHQVAPQLPSITELNLVLCQPLSGMGLEAFGRHCGSLTRLYITLDDEKCFAIARHMMQLNHLHARYSNRPSRAGIQAILESCTNLRAFVFESPCHEPRMSKTFLKDCMRRRRHYTGHMFFGCPCCRGYEWDFESDCFLERRYN